MLGEGVLCLACDWGLEEWEGGLELRLRGGLPSCVVTEIWGSERPVEVKQRRKSGTKAALYIVFFKSSIYSKASVIQCFVQIVP